MGALQSRTFDLAIIGGGLTGASLAYFSVSAGLSVALLEAQDYAGGRSGEISNLMYGGLSPMVSSSFGQAKKSSLDAQYWYQRFPHLVQRTAIAMPLRSRMRWLKTKCAAVSREVLGGIPEADRHLSWPPERIQFLDEMLDASRFPYARSHFENF